MNSIALLHLYIIITLSWCYQRSRYRDSCTNATNMQNDVYNSWKHALLCVRSYLDHVFHSSSSLPLPLIPFFFSPLSFSLCLPAPPPPPPVVAPLSRLYMDGATLWTLPVFSPNKSRLYCHAWKHRTRGCGELSFTSGSVAGMPSHDRRLHLDFELT